MTESLTITIRKEEMIHMRWRLMDRALHQIDKKLDELGDEFFLRDIVFGNDSVKDVVKITAHFQKKA